MVATLTSLSLPVPLQGAVDVFVKKYLDASNSTFLWIYSATLFASDGYYLDGFGSALGLQGHTIIAGSPTRNKLIPPVANVVCRERHSLFYSSQNASAFPKTTPPYRIQPYHMTSGYLNACVQGQAYVFTYRNVSGTFVWSQDAILNRTNPHDQDSFGQAVSVSGDYAVVGSSTNLQNTVSKADKCCGAPVRRAVLHVADSMPCTFFRVLRSCTRGTPRRTGGR